ncbi:hypothetical protein [Streptomyces sp. NPDC050982]|uniref:hypothetical protein n=1 Tax=Streptomyces sp. NPDC050982 TaxID=3154746 RepID=UPI0033F31338
MTGDSELSDFLLGWHTRAEKQRNECRLAMQEPRYLDQLKRLLAAAENLEQQRAQLEETLKKATRSGRLTPSGSKEAGALLRLGKGSARKEIRSLLAAVAQALEGREGVTGERLASSNLRQIRDEIVIAGSNVEDRVEELLDSVEEAETVLRDRGRSQPSSTGRAEVRLQIPWNERDETA